MNRLKYLYERLMSVCEAGEDAIDWLFGKGTSDRLTLLLLGTGLVLACLIYFPVGLIAVAKRRFDRFRGIA